MLCSYSRDELGDVCRCGLNDDASGLLFSVSGRICSSQDMEATAIALKNTINEARHEKAKAIEPMINPFHRSSKMSSNEARNDVYLQQLLSTGALQFNEFVVGGGQRRSYSFTSSAICTGKGLSHIGR